MGGGFSLPQRPDTIVQTSANGGDTSNWDHWGYVPPGVQHPAQKIAAVSFRDSYNYFAVYNGAYNIAMQPSQIFGTDEHAPQEITTTHTGKTQNGYVTSIVQPFGVTYDSNMTFAEGEGNLCSPDNFPNCDNYPMGKFNATSLFGFKGEFTPAYVGEIISDQISAYQNGNFSYVDSMNSQETGGYVSACDGPSLLDQILPVAAGVIVVLAKTRFIDPELAILGMPSDAKFVLTLNAFLAGYYLGKQAVIPFGADEANGYKAAMCIARGISYVGVNYFTQNAQLQPLPQFAISLLGAEIVANVVGTPLAIFIDKTVALTSAPMRAIATLWRTIQSLFCHWSQGTVIACDDAKTFPDARRWAIAELAAKLTDELCGEEGWQRESPQAKYAMQAFLKSPSWALAGLDWGDNGDHTTRSYGSTALGNVTWNPVGEIVQTSYWGGQYKLGGDQFGVFDIQNPDSSSVNVDPSGFANSNMIACQQYEALAAGTGVGTAGADPALALNFAKNLKRWKESVRESAYNPANWVAADNILSGTGPTVTTMSPQLYLLNRLKPLARGGFDDIQSRSLYALLYTEQGDMTEEEWLYIQVNQLMADCIDINKFGEKLTKHGVTLNWCGCIAYAAIEPENGPQRIFWREWLETEDEQVKACFGLFTKDTLIPPLMRHLPMLPPPPPPPTQLGPRFVPFGAGEHLTNFFGNLISPDEVALLLKQWDAGLNQAIGEMGESYLAVWPTDQHNNLYANAFEIVTGTLWLANQTTDIEGLWNQLEPDPIMTKTNQFVNIPQMYAIMFAILTVRPPTNWNTLLSNTWDDYVAPLTPAHAKILSQYNNPYLRTTLEQ